ncbi:MAG: 2,3-bisphosphoglycerate-independent phosphoglycerate mutase [Puniceicoccales bacterium]|jgi:2,3-bisphosphoglycerate-independent phosphoglycerate mutase|nr:2,3-bisphosphoglycerate-independent phosphoglycerate mutase [Puniceicoccales bacterium]
MSQATSTAPTAQKPLTPTVLIIRDGWGENHNPAHDSFNAIKLADIPVSRRLSAEWPRTEIAAHGPDVGLPEGVMGNSEVGHQNIGAGRIVDQEILRLNKCLADPAFAQNADFLGAVEFVKKNGGKLHLFGLASAAGVHSELSHLYALVRFAKAALAPNVTDNTDGKIFVHAFTDGRDSPPTSGLGFIAEIEEKLAEIGAGKIASVAGRFWAMDRDNRFSRVQKAYDALTGGDALTAPSAAVAVQTYYDKPLDPSRTGDEFVLPTRIVGSDGKPVALIADGDAVIFFNFRGDRPREITRCFIFDDAQLGELVELDKNGAVVHAFTRPKKLNLFYATLTDYQKGLCANILFRKPPKMVNILGDWISKHNIAQFRTAETEKYPHVTFFFNDYRDEPFPLEDRECAPSPKDVATYDLKPEMSSVTVTHDATKAILARSVVEDNAAVNNTKTADAKEAILGGKYGLIVINYANPDMVGHTGNLPAVIKACEAVDKGLGELLAAIDKVGGNALICADHGNADQMWEPETNSPHTRHTLNPVEVIIYGKDKNGASLQSKKMAPLNTGRLADIAPTVLALMGLPQPPEMTGKSLIAG